MDPVRKALWFVESYLLEEISLERIAAACKVSAYHLTRTFSETTGLSLMRYVRARRLSEAARRLAEGARDILEVALDAGYGSHEAFTRAFREQFNLTPEEVRARGCTTELSLVEAFVMSGSVVSSIEPTVIEKRRALRLAGLVNRHDCQAPTGIPDQWRRFVPHIGNIPGQVGWGAYGVVFNFDREGTFDYLAGVEIAENADAPHGLELLTIPEREYAVFEHRGHIAGIRDTIGAIWREWLPASGRSAVDAPSIEFYGPEFNPVTGMGGVGIWVPIGPATA